MCNAEMGHAVSRKCVSSGVGAMCDAVMRCAVSRKCVLSRTEVAMCSGTSSEIEM